MAENEAEHIPEGFLGWVSFLVQTHRSRLSRIAQAEGLRNEDALDAVQDAFETFLLLPQARELVSHAEDSAKFLTVIVRNHARNIRRKQHRRAALIPQEENVRADDTPSNTDDAETLILEAEKHVSLLGCLKKLKEIQKHVITLRIFEGRDGDEVAKSLDISTGNVATILNRAKISLQECLLS